MGDKYDSILSELKERAKDARRREERAKAEQGELSVAIKAIERLRNGAGRSPIENAGSEPGTTSKDMVLMVLKESEKALTVDEIAERALRAGADINLNTLRWALHAWQNEDMVKKVGYRRYMHKNNADSVQELNAILADKMEGGEE